MFARITKYKMNPDRMDEATALVEQLLPEIMAMPGVLNFINVANDDGSGYVISVNESQEASDTNAEKVQAIWAKFADFLTEPPTAEGYNVLYNERNG